MIEIYQPKWWQFWKIDKTRCRAKIFDYSIGEDRQCKWRILAVLDGVGFCKYHIGLMNKPKTEKCDAGNEEHISTNAGRNEQDTLRPETWESSH